MHHQTQSIRIDDDSEHGASIFARCVQPTSHERTHRSPTSHSFAALAFCVGGGARIEQRGTWMLEPGDVLIVPAGHSHRSVDARRTDMWGVGVYVPCLAPERSGALGDPFERVREGASPVVRIPSARHSFLESLFKELSAISAARRPDAAVRESLLTLIVSEVAQAAVWSSAAASQTSIVSRSLHFIERHCLEPLTLKQIAAAMGRTPSHITTALTRATGRSAVAWIIAGRMAEARRRLLHSNERVDDIAEQLGYADVTHFIRLFRRAHGATPVAWRAAQRRALPQLELRSSVE
jgi:AraC family transcriptional regulator, transcriptional activator of pobA